MSEALFEIMEPKIIEIKRQAKEEGMERGMEREKKESAKRMLESGRLTIEDVAEYSGLTAEQINDLRKELHLEAE